MRLLTLLLILPLSLIGQAQSLSEREVIKADSILNRLICSHSTTEARKIYFDTFQLTTSAGKVKSKTDILKEIELPELIFELNVTEGVKIILEGKTAILMGTLHQRGTYLGKPFDHSLLVTDTWIFTEDGWKILAGHATLLPKN
jgi:hypothetical protein